MVQGARDIVVNGRSRDCRPLRDDPLDKVRIRPTFGERPKQSEIVALATGGFAFGAADAESVTGPDRWARVGTGIDQYVFRSPNDGRPLCIGAHAPERHTWGQLRKIVDAAPYRGKRVRFTAWVATRDAELVRFWVVGARAMRRVYNGGNTNNRPWGGNHGWTPVMVEVGPIAPKADHISYGFLLYGHGAVWVYRPQLEIVNDEPGASRRGDLLFIGSSVR